MSIGARARAACIVGPRAGTSGATGVCNGCASSRGSEYRSDGRASTIFLVISASDGGQGGLRARDERDEDGEEGGGAEHVGEGACGRCGGCVRATGAVVVPLADPKNVFAFNTGGDNFRKTETRGRRRY